MHYIHHLLPCILDLRLWSINVYMTARQIEIKVRRMFHKSKEIILNIAFTIHVTRLIYLLCLGKIHSTAAQHILNNTQWDLNVIEVLVVWESISL